MSSAYDKGMLESQTVGRKEVWGGNAQEGTRSLNVTLQSDDVESLDSAPKLLLEKVAMREDASSSTEAIEVESTGAATRNAPLSVQESVSRKSNIEGKEMIFTFYIDRVS